MTIRDRTVLITGASRGIGRATAIVFGQLAANVVLTARDQAALERVASEVSAAGGRALVVAADVSRPEQVTLLAERAYRTFGAVDILVNNAAIIDPVCPIWQVDPDEWLCNMNINLAGPFLCTRAFLPAMIEQRSGCIINVTSGAAQNPVENWSAYCASKAGLDQLTRVVAGEVNRYGIGVAAFGPGGVDTPMQERIRRLHPEQFPDVARFREYKTRSMLADPHDPARAIAWLATLPANRLRGQLITRDAPEVRRGISVLFAHKST